MKLVTASQMRELDRAAIAAGMHGRVLMENAGAAVEREVLAVLCHASPGPVHVVCGRGNNGGDGFVVARRLRVRGVPVSVSLAGDPNRIVGDALANYELMCRTGVPIQPIPARASVIVDALIGTGAAGAPHGAIAEAIAAIGAHPAPVIAVDVPSGIVADTGATPGVAVRADVTVTFGYAKPGLLMHPGAEMAGRLIVDPIGFDWDALPMVTALEWYDAARAAGAVRGRARTAHKGDFGHVLVVGGSEGMGGAVALAARAALRAGAGLVSAAVPAAIHAIVAGHVPEVMCRPVPDSHGAMGPDSGRAIEQAMERCDAVCVGPGLSLAPPAQHAARWLIGQCPLPLVVDADALTAISGALAGTPLRRSAATVLTPHPGECARLLGSSVADVQSDRIGAAREVAKRYGAVVVLKGARTVIAEPAQGEGRTAIITTGNPGMATAGAGDVLTGVVGCLLAQGMGPYEAACLGAFVHGRAGDEAAQRLGECGLLASDIADALPRAIGMTRMPDPSAEVTSDA